MAIDPSDPETFETAADVEELDPEAPEADAAEQQTELVGRGDVPPPGQGLGAADPADAAEQARVVEIDEDDYR